MYTATRIIPFSNGKVFMSNTSEFYKTSVDHGQSWSTGPIVRSLDYTAYNSQGSIISVGSSGGTPYSYSTDYGVTWFNGNLPAASIFNTCVWAGNAFVLVNFGGTTYHVSQTGIDGSWITYSGLPVWQGVGGGVSIRKNTLFFAGYSSPNCCEITVNDDLTLYIKQYSMSKVGSGYGWLDLSNDFMLFTDYDSYGHRFVHKKTLTSYTTFNTVKIKGVYCSDNGNYIIGSDYSQGIYRAFLPQFRTQAVTY
jgi:hypothetical protein